MIKNKNATLQKRIIITFSLVSALPALIVAIFSIYFFYFGVRIWFDQRILKILEQSRIVAESYLDEHRLQLKETALSIADDLDHMYYDLINNLPYFNTILNGQVVFRSLDEAIVFQSSSNSLLAQSALSFSLSFATIPFDLLQKADSGEIVEITSDLNKIRMLIKLREFQDTYLLIGRLVDQRVIDHIDQTNGAVAEYYRLKTQISEMQMKFLVMFILMAIILLVAAITSGAVFASRILSPISRLVSATQKVKDGDLTVQVPEEGLRRDEIYTLSAAFNRMVRQIAKQQRDLVVAQRAQAWADVAKRVAHEIKNPLTPIQLATERLSTKFYSVVGDKEAFAKYLKIIDRHTQDIKRIVAEFVNFARLPAPTFTKCELVNIIKELVEARKLLNDKITYTFYSNVATLNFVCDTMQLHQVMVNLMKNAEEALEHDIVNPQISVNLEYDSTNQLVKINVKDNGPGFPEEFIHSATEAYATTRTKGMGLGLSIVKKIIQDHFGEINIENNLDSGAMVKLIFDMQALQERAG